MCGLDDCTLAATCSTATYHKINAKWITDGVLKGWCQFLDVDYGLVVSSRKTLRIASHHFRDKYFRSVRIASAYCRSHAR